MEDVNSMMRGTHESTKVEPPLNLMMIPQYLTVFNMYMFTCIIYEIFLSWNKELELPFNAVIS